MNQVVQIPVRELQCIRASLLEALDAIDSKLTLQEEERQTGGVVSTTPTCGVSPKKLSQKFIEKKLAKRRERVRGR